MLATISLVLYIRIFLENVIFCLNYLYELLIGKLIVSKELKLLH